MMADRLYVHFLARRTRINQLPLFLPSFTFPFLYYPMHSHSFSASSVSQHNLVFRIRMDWLCRISLHHSRWAPSTDNYSWNCAMSSSQPWPLTQ